MCIHQGRLLNDPKRPRDYTPEQYLKSRRRKWPRCSPTCPKRCENSVEIAKRCNLELSFGNYYLPAFPVPAGADDRIVHPRAVAQDGLEARLAQARACAEGFSAEDYAQRLRPRTRRHRQDGLRRLLPDRRGLHQLGQAATTFRSDRGAARVPVRSSPGASASPISIRCATVCCSSASSIPNACRCPTSTSTSAWTAATR